MLSILKIKKKENIQKLKLEYGDFHGKIKDIIPANKEWFNSVYAFEKNSLKLLPVADNIVSNFIKSYFYMFYNIIEKTRYRRRQIRARRFSSRKIWVSRPEIKHTNSNIIITLYLYNRQNHFIEKKIVKLENILYRIIKKNFLREKYLDLINKVSKDYKIFTNIFYKILSIKVKLLSKTYKLNIRLRDKLYKILTLNIYLNFNKIRDMINTPVKNFIKKQYLINLKSKQIMLFNKFKLGRFILHLKPFLENIYRKNVEFNIVSLKNFQLSSDILSQILTTKIRRKKNRAVRVIKASIRSIRTPILNERTLKREHSKLMEKQNLIIRDFLKTNNNYLDICIKNKGIKWVNNLDLELGVLDNTRYKLINGITLKASGRITRRIIAERARCSIRSIGTLKNVNTSYKGLSSVMVRGYKKSNIDNTYLWSKTHVGAFGLKGWISSY